MTDRIPFAQFVLNDIQQNGAEIMQAFMGGDYIIPSRLFQYNEKGPLWWRAKEKTEKDDWSLYTGWNLFGHWATIVRGPNNFCIKVKGKMALALRNEEARLYAERRAAIKAQKAERKKKELDAAWWP